jgi:oligoribonuclease
VRYVSVDIETTGLDPTINQVIEVAAVLEDTTKDTLVDALPYFRAVIVYEKYATTPYCAVLHQRLFEDIVNIGTLPFEAHYITNGDNVDVYVRPHALSGALRRWLSHHGEYGKMTVAGKNYYGFDHRFLAPLLGDIEVRHRALDPVTLYTRKDDVVPPDMAECCERAGIPLVGHHTALADARTVISLLRRRMCAV